MNLKQKFLSSSIAASALAVSAVAPVAHAEVEVSAEIGAASMYYWRGQDLGGGAAVWGDLSISSNGFYAGLWTSSGDAENGTEYDIYLGYAGEAGDFSYDLGIVTYVYPETEQSPGDNVEAYLGLGYGAFSVTYFHGLEDLEDYWYVIAGVDVGDFNFSYGLHETDYSHFDITYNYNANVSFTLGLVIDDADDPGLSDEAKFLVSFSLPIDF